MYANNRSYYKDRFEILADLEKTVATAAPGRLEDCIMVPYKDFGFIIFYFSHFEEGRFGELTAVYSFNSTAS